MSPGQAVLVTSRCPYNEYWGTIWPSSIPHSINALTEFIWISDGNLAIAKVSLAFNEWITYLPRKHNYWNLARSYLHVKSPIKLIPRLRSFHPGAWAATRFQPRPSKMVPSWSAPTKKLSCKQKDYSKYYELFNWNIILPISDISPTIPIHMEILDFFHDKNAVGNIEAAAIPHHGMVNYHVWQW